GNGIVMAGYSYFVGRNESCIALQEIDALLCKLGAGLFGRATTQAVDYLPNPPLHGGLFSLGFGDVQPIPIGMSRFVQQVSDKEHSFGWVAAIVKAGTAEFPTLHHCDAQ